MAFPQAAHRGPSGDPCLPEPCHAGAQSGERWSLGAADLIRIQFQRFLLAASGQVTFLSLSFPFWQIGLSTVLTLQDHGGIIDNVCTVSGRC